MQSLPPGQPRRAGTGPADLAPPPAEYGAAVDRYLASAALGPASPVFLSGRRARAGTSPAHTCPVTGRARLSYRRAAEIFTEVTRGLDPAGHSWALHQLRRVRPPGHEPL